MDGASIDNRGVVRTGLIARDGANVIVKNSRIRTREGVLPADYEPGFGANMMTVPWMLGLSGNVRATNVLGENTTATYLNSRISSEAWGVLSTDSVRNSALTAVNSTVTITGDSGYGTYADGASQQDVFLGTHFDVATFADSTREAVAALSTEADLRLSEGELAAIEPRPSVVDSGGFGVVWHSGDGGSVSVGGVPLTSGTFAVATDDQGHYRTTMSPGLIGTYPTLKADFGYKSEHQLAVVAQDIVKRFYREAAGHSYPSAPDTRRSAAGSTGSG
ncbi:hypothetical protein R6V09_22845 [Streptomyces sp. W16]|uniref:hypothetical protein n=1 Tax=Streptomyces sp. W16 TaxID=3076631 RepID=UPI00295B47E2|nr:hypothetical protein [Streptomyces sp. W16]MDV9172940.1 hypothetical protein [Streptomyces sp. W16]